MNLETKAREFATLYHNGQLRKYINTPYIEHPEAVASIVKTVVHTEEMIAAALLHDTVEDTDATLVQINNVFGFKIYQLVEMLTDISIPSDGNRNIRKRIDRDHISKASPAAKTIKLADLIDNSSSIIKYDKKFAKVYLQEMKSLLEVLKDGDQKLWILANSITL